VNIPRVLPVLILSAALLGGCASLGPPAPPPVRVPEILALSHESVPADDIIAKMRQSETVYRLTASQLAKLHEQGVSDRVIDYMQRTYLDAVARRQALADWNNWRFEDGWWYGGPAWGWPQPWYP
jgi:hypothetical protein